MATINTSQCHTHFEGLCKGIGDNRALAKDLQDVYAPVSVDEQERLHTTKPWKSDPNFFKKARITANAVVKMVTHVASGGDIEVMGLMQGRIVGNDFIITDAFPLPVEGTETRVNAGAAANEFMINFVESNETQVSNDNRANEPFVAVVIDPVKTTSQRRIEIGAFRTYEKSSSAPSGTAADGAARVVGNIPLDKVQDFGAHANSYYALQVEYLKSPLDNLILSKLSNSSWGQGFSSTTTTTTADQQLPYLRKLVADAGAKTAASLEEITADRGRIAGASSTSKDITTTEQQQHQHSDIGGGIEEQGGDHGSMDNGQKPGGERHSKKHKSSSSSGSIAVPLAGRGPKGRHQRRNIELQNGIHEQLA
ncbi:COP9 signalosome complex subunit 5 [Perkinsus chesapeaki]|uniref:COP9 signalosome complex subunit 5 n=1 Tax=Perkinsus chesapeaki TaxID=330153 RepID=A0A7J6MY25_PERCH|nr:COP9 signalosome complex subunit 5 [Perkinsus chesapeaki]